MNSINATLHFLLSKLEFITKKQENANKEGGKQNARTIKFLEQR